MAGSFAVSPETEKKFSIYVELLTKWQAKINLVGADTLQDVRTRHIEDSMQIADLIPHEKKFVVFDLGSGAGFPGMVIAMMRDDLDVHLIESDSRKCAFLSAVSRETKTIVSIHNERAEKFSHEKIPDIITARAVAPLEKLFAYVLPWAQKNPDLLLLFPKGESVQSEIDEAQKKYSFESILRPSKTAASGVILEIRGLCIT